MLVQLVRFVPPYILYTYKIILITSIFTTGITVSYTEI